MTGLDELLPAFRTKVTEPLPLTTAAERIAALEAAGHNLFRIPAAKVSIDLLTDSGTGALSAAQWASMITADEAYAGARSWEHFRDTVRAVTGFPRVLPTHQGRAAERLLLRALVQRGDLVPGNGHFDTTRAHIESLGGEALDLPIREALQPGVEHPWKGDVDLAALDRALASGRRIPLVIVTITSNRTGGQPVSLDNLHEVAQRCRARGVPLFLDAARFAENAGLARARDPDLAALSPADVARSYFDLADGCTMSAKKDGLANIGGFLALRDPALARRIEPQLVLDEGFLTYGGLAGRDLDAIAVGLREALDPRYLVDRLRSVERLHHALVDLDIPVIRPCGGHAVYVDAGAWLPQIPKEQFPGQALAAALYLAGGVRSCEMGSLMFGVGADGRAQHVPLELLRLAVPRRMYGGAHLDYVAAVFAEVARGKSRLRGYHVAEAADVLRHFTARLIPDPDPGDIPAQAAE